MNRMKVKVPEGWKIYKFGEIVTKSQYGTSISHELNGTIPMIRMNNLVKGRLLMDNLAYMNISKDEFEKLKLEKDDLLFNRTNSYDLVGKTALFEGEGDFTFASYLVRFKLDYDIAFPKYINYFFNLPSSQTLLKSLSTKGVSQVNINPTVLKNYFLIPLPPTKEQQKVSKILSTWDRGIEKTEKLIEIKTKRKKGLMQQLLSVKKRFKEFEKETWPKLRLGDFLTFKPRPVIKPQNPYWALGIRSHGKGTFIKKVREPEKIMMDTLFNVKENDLIVNITFAWEGAVALVKKSDEGTLVSHRFPTYVFKEDVVSPEFFKQVILQKNFVHKLGIISPGGAGRNRVLSKKDFLKLGIKIPPIEEQQKMAGILSAADQEVELLKQQLEKLKGQKKGLMQKLLTGQTRVNINT